MGELACTTLVEIIESGGAALNAAAYVINPPTPTIVAAKDPDVLTGKPTPPAVPVMADLLHTTRLSYGRAIEQAFPHRHGRWTGGAVGITRRLSRRLVRRRSATTVATGWSTVTQLTYGGGRGRTRTHTPRKRVKVLCHLPWPVRPRRALLVWLPVDPSQVELVERGAATGRARCLLGRVFSADRLIVAVVVSSSQVLTGLFVDHTPVRVLVAGLAPPPCCTPWPGG
jgi:hypothetical protein